MAIVAKAPRLGHGTSGASRLREQKILEQLAVHVPRRRSRGAPPPDDRAPPRAGQGVAAGQAAAAGDASGAGQRRSSPANGSCWGFCWGTRSIGPRCCRASGPSSSLSPACRKIYETSCRLIEAGSCPTSTG